MKKIEKHQLNPNRAEKTLVKISYIDMYVNIFDIEEVIRGSKGLEARLKVVTAEWGKVHVIIIRDNFNLSLKQLIMNCYINLKCLISV